MRNIKTMAAAIMVATVMLLTGCSGNGQTNTSNGNLSVQGGGNRPAAYTEP